MIIKLIQAIHLALILMVSLSIFVPSYKIKKIALITLIYVFVQYIFNYGKCGLTELEYLFRGESYKEGFIYRLITPIITIPEKYFDEQLYWIHLIWIIILGYQLIHKKYNK